MTNENKCLRKLNCHREKVTQKRNTKQKEEMLSPNEKETKIQKTK